MSSGENANTSGNNISVLLDWPLPFSLYCIGHWNLGVFVNELKDIYSGANVVYKITT